MLAAGVLAVFWAQFAWVSPTNFGGYDEWLMVSLNAKRIVDIPYTGRPLTLLWSLLVPLLAPHSLTAYLVVHGLYLAMGGVVVLLLCRRLWPDEPLFAFVTACLTVAWVPMDYMRLDPVLMVSGAGSTAGTLLALLLLVESHRRQSVPLLAAGALLAFVLLRGSEAVAGILVAAPLVSLALPAVRRKRLAYEAIAWECAVGAAVGLAALNVFGGRQGSYQSSAMGFDPWPPRVLWRLLLQLRFHLGPLVTPSLSELAVAAVPIAAALFVGASWILIRAAGRSDGWPERRQWLARMAGGLAFAVVAYSVFVLSSKIVTPARTQLLAAPGIALFLTASAGLLARALPRRRRELALVLFGAFVVAVGTARTLAMQRDWDAATAFPAQSRSLADLTRQAPDLEPNTLVVLVNAVEVWPATFTFRHAVGYLYQGRVTGVVQGAHEFLYPCSFGPGGVVCEPWPVIRGPWRSPVTRHRYDELVVAALTRDGRLSILDQWPSEGLPPLPSGARYAPGQRVRPLRGPIPEQRILPR
jgi:hypothetical protein